MNGQVSGVGLGAALALTAAAGSAAVGIPLQRLGLLVFLLAVLLATRWWGHRAGAAALVTSVAIALGLLVSALGPSAASGVDAAAMTLLAVLGAGIAAWTVPRAAAVASPMPSADARRLKEEFLATVSHELRTPLNAILGWTELLRMPRAVPLQQVDRGLEVIERNARRQLLLVDELLAAAEPATPPEAWQRLDLADLVHSLLASLAPAAAAAQVTLDDEAPARDAAGGAGLGPIWVRGDAGSLRLALRHVLDNAIKFTPAGGRVTTRVRQSGDRALVFVSDTGPGIPPALADHVFEPFRQQDGSAARAHGGLGLGLTIARKLVERHGGHLDLRGDTPDGGATLLVTLPAAPE